MASIRKNTYAGPLPETAVTGSNKASSFIDIASPTADSKSPQSSVVSPDTLLFGTNTVTPLPTEAGVLGIARTIDAF